MARSTTKTNGTTAKRKPGRPKTVKTPEMVEKEEATPVVVKDKPTETVEDTMKEAVKSEPVEAIPEKTPEEQISPVEVPTPVSNPQSQFYDPEYDPAKQDREMKEAIAKKNRVIEAERNSQTQQAILRRRLGR